MRSVLAVILFASCSRATPVMLTVMTKPPTRVTVIAPSGASIDLGQTPIDKAPANVGDRVRLTSEDGGIRYEETIEFGTAGEQKTIVKSFQ